MTQLYLTNKITIKCKQKNEQTSEHNLVTQHRTQQDHRL